ncbi:MAG: D-aminoacyl-tRNA deacylase [Bacteroidales bacterium]|nr:D-aminoacyl-tRNA deacylase [Bacteroidales bacterium]
MRIVIQKVKQAAVAINGKEVSHIGKGLMILVGVENADTDADVDWLCHKIMALRIFDDENGVMNLSIAQVAGADILLVSQFTLMASTKKGNRPSYIRASRPEHSEPMYNMMAEKLSEMIGHPIPTGRFGALMDVSLVNDGPTTIIIDSHLKE